jgi:aminomethyltransferase
MTGRVQPVYHLALRELLTAAGARFTARSGWSIPANFGDAMAEYTAIRERAALLERSWRSRFMVTGTDASVVLARVFEGYVDELEEGRAKRTVSLDEAGLIEDVVLIARTGGIAYLVSGEPGQRESTLKRLREAIEESFDAEVSDRTMTTCLLGVTGPQAADIVRTHMADALPRALRPMQCVTFEFHGFRTLAMRTSETGEDGFEFMLAPAVEQHAIETLRSAGVGLAGLDAQETTRVEMCIPAFKPDLETGVTPAEAELDALFGLLSDGAGRGQLLAALLIEGSAPTAPGAALTRSGEPAGQLRSCVHSPALNATIALGIINAAFASPGEQLELGAARATVIAKPFLRRRTV